MVFWNYIWTVRTDPGTVPKGWKPDLRSTEGYEVKKLTGAPRYCRTCERYKPPRSHHCRQCKKCVLRMDHHCPWVNNCVGHFNYGHFIRFLFYVDVACSYHFAMISMRAWYAMNASGFWQGPSTSELVFMILNYAACTPVLLLVGGFSLYHFYCLASNQTTIEGWEKDKVATLVRKGKIREVKFPYHLGAGRNIRAILGEQVWLWCWPQRMRGSGVSFPVADGTVARAIAIMGGQALTPMSMRVGPMEDATDLVCALLIKKIWCNAVGWRRNSLENPETQFEWPPKDPNVYKDRNIASATALQKRLQGSPWTYGNEGFNPALRMRVANNHPPYHPSYQAEGPSDESIHPEIDAGRQFDHEYDSVSTSSSPSRASSEYDVDMSADRDVRMRRGSEGWEVRPMTNEEIVQRYARSRGLETITRPEPEPDEDEPEDEGEPLDHNSVGEGTGVPVSPPKYNVYVPEDPDSSEDEALGAHIGTYTNE
ncbi:DHHC palmitoyltransferase [Rhizoctonia solani]|uniref:Palmitoyltransferase n=1 Tax=Rhizoctonia solani TaxID=456999 RepID=A0A8H8NY71_9AGAM|nr:DHHC palmitoyltransferase [Rhizoctonia solani]QRW22306.1 DHHC palmitoyltransferase [Rhizoctonia solani]